MKTITRLFFIFSFMQVFTACSSDLPVRITVETGPFPRSESVISLDLNSITFLNENKLTLYHLDNGEKIPVPIQIVNNNGRWMHWQIPVGVPAETRLTYELVNEKAVDKINTQTIENGKGNLVLEKNHKNVLQYNASVVLPPPGADLAYKRSGFVHPLYAPNGAILTEIQPADHLHHYGIWNPWTKTTFMGEEIDFWNLIKKQGTVRHARVLRTLEGPVFAEMEFLHNHVAWPESTRQTLAMAERHIIRSFNHTQDIFVVEFEFHLSPKEKITLEEYRYGGFVFRGNAGWTNATSDFITSEGLDRDQADGQRARWCIVSGETPKGKAGVLFMGNPSNFNHPEPLRVWPSNGNGGRGDVFINLSPTRNTSWQLLPDQTYTLQYRLIVFAGEMDTEKAQQFWNDYANPMVVKWKK
jgi:hypothetical protein